MQSLCALCPSLHSKGRQCFPVAQGFCRGNTHYYFLGVRDAGVVGEHDKSRVMGKVGMGEFFPSDKEVFLRAVGIFINLAVVCVTTRR